MRPLLLSQCNCVRWLIVAFAAVALPRAGDAADPVLKLAQVLQEQEQINPNDPAEGPKEVKRQKELLEKGAAAVTRLGDLRRALLLPEWKRGEFDQQPGEDDPLGKVYREIWGKLADRLTKALRSRLAAKDDAGQRLAVVTFLAEMASDEHKAEKGEHVVDPAMPRGIRIGGPVIRFTPRMAADLRELLAKDKDADVCATAARAMVEIAPTGAATLEALKPLLGSGRKVVERRAAAEGLGQMFGVLATPQQGEHVPQRPGIAPQQRPSRIDQLGPRIISAAGSGLDDKDATVRRLCLETIRQAARYMLQGPEVIRPLAGAVNAQTAGAVRLLADGDLAVRLSAHQVLEDAASGRRRLRGSGPWKYERPFFHEPKPQPAEEQTILDGVLKALPGLKTSLADDEVRVRLAALYVLETLDEAAAPAAEEVAKTLKDKNGFVRWGAARVLNNMAPQAPDKAVPALAEALSDDNKTVRLTAVAALQRYGPKATAAVKSLGKAIGDPEPRMRVGAINALALIGVKARPESAALVHALKADKTPEVRAAAAKALGRLERFDAETMKALRAALRDADAVVRQAASETLLDDRP